MWNETLPNQGDAGVSCDYASRLTAIATRDAAYESFIGTGRAP